MAKSRKQDYPRICGEKCHEESFQYHRVGITPACAGKSIRPTAFALRNRDHPRMCGEKAKEPKKPLADRGSPPHMRGKAGLCLIRPCSVGITPAYAGKSCRCPCCCCQTGDHPRICGEKGCVTFWLRNHSGSPPHMRGKDGTKEWADKMGRITPAYTGKRVRCQRSW